MSDLVINLASLKLHIKFEAVKNQGCCVFTQLRLDMRILRFLRCEFEDLKNSNAKSTYTSIYSDFIRKAERYSLVECSFFSNLTIFSEGWTIFLIGFVGHFKPDLLFLRNGWKLSRKSWQNPVKTWFFVDLRLKNTVLENFAFFACVSGWS